MLPTSVVVRLTGMRLPTLLLWARNGIIHPRVEGTPGPNSGHMWSYKQVFVLGLISLLMKDYQRRRMVLGSVYAGKIMEEAEATTSDEDFILWAKEQPDEWEAEKVAEADARLRFMPVEDWPRHWGPVMGELLGKLRAHMDATAALDREESLAEAKEVQRAKARMRGEG